MNNFTRRFVSDVLLIIICLAIGFVAGRMTEGTEGREISGCEKSWAHRFGYKTMSLACAERAVELKPDAKVYIDNLHREEKECKRMRTEFIEALEKGKGGAR